MDYEEKTPSELWSLAWRGSITDRNLYFIMSELVLKYNKYPSGTFFPPKSGPFLLDLLEKPHEPQLKIVVCTLIGYLCNVTSTAKEDLAKRGVIDLLLRIIELGLPEKDNSTENNLVRMLFEHVTSMLQFFSLGPDLCLRKMSVTDALGVIGQLIDTDNPSMFGYDAPTTLQKLVDGRLLVAEQFDLTPTAASVVLYRQLGYDFKSRFHITDSYVLDLYDTNGDDDIRVVEELDKRSKFMMLYGSREDECEIEDVSKFSVVDVKVTFCLNSAYFWAVLGHENIDRLSEFESELSVGSRFLDLGKTPSIGQMVGAAKENGSVYRGQVLMVDDDLVTVFAIDYGFVKVLPVHELKAIGCETKFQTEGVARLCKVLGVRRMPVCPEITKNLLLTLCNLTADLSTGMAERILSMNLLPSLNHLSTYPDIHLSICVIQVLSNMAHNTLLKSNFVNFGILDSVIGVVKRNMGGLSRPSSTHNPDCDQLIESCVVLFWNLIYNHQTNKEELVKRGGIHVVTELTGTDKPESVRQTALKTLRIFLDRVAVSTYKNHRRPREDTFESVPDSNHSDSEAASDSSGETKLLSLPLASPKGGEKLEKTRILQHTALDAAVEYIQGEKIFLRTGDDCELLFYSVDAVSEKTIARIVCGFLNRWNEGGSIYFGIKKNGEVEGQLVPHSARDCLRLCIDKLTIKKFSPAVPAGVISTLFHPVLDTENGQHLTDCFVIEIRVKATLASTLYGVKHTGEPKQFVRVGTKTIEMTAKDVYVWTVETYEESKLKDLRQLQHEVEQLRKIRNKMNKC